MGNDDHRQRVGLPAAHAGTALAGRRRLRMCTGEGQVSAAMRAIRKYSELRRARRASRRMEERRRSVQVIVQRRLVVEGLPHPAYAHPASVVRDMRKSSVLKHGRFPDT